jgi:hypothetical protein
MIMGHVAAALVVVVQQRTAMVQSAMTRITIVFSFLSQFRGRKNLFECPTRK